MNHAFQQEATCQHENNILFCSGGFWDENACSELQCDTTTTIHLSFSLIKCLCRCRLHRRRSINLAIFSSAVSQIEDAAITSGSRYQQATFEMEVQSITPYHQVSTLTYFSEKRKETWQSNQLFHLFPIEDNVYTLLQCVVSDLSTSRC